MGAPKSKNKRVQIFFCTLLFLDEPAGEGRTALVWIGFLQKLFLKESCKWIVAHAVIIILVGRHVFVGVVLFLV